MKDEDIRKQIEDKLQKIWAKSKCEKCKYRKDCDSGTLYECTYYKLIDKLIEARKTIKSQRESLERFILGERE
jgi:hypothetical protein